MDRQGPKRRGKGGERDPDGDPEAPSDLLLRASVASESLSKRKDAFAPLNSSEKARREGVGGEREKKKSPAPCPARLPACLAEMDAQPGWLRAVTPAPAAGGSPGMGAGVGTAPRPREGGGRASWVPPLGVCSRTGVGARPTGPPWRGERWARESGSGGAEGRVRDRPSQWPAALGCPAGPQGEAPRA